MNFNKSAYNEALKVYSRAMLSRDYAAAVKAIIYCSANQIDLYGEQAAIDLLKEDVMLLPQPAKSVIYAITGNIYNKYYTSVKWQIRSRTRAAVDESDMKTWDITRLFEETLKCYKLSIQDEETLKRMPLDDYREIVDYKNDTTLKRIVFPTLYDFLVFNTISAFKGEASVVLPQQAFVLDRPEYFADVNTFVNYRIETPDSLSAEYNVISLYQKLLKFRLQENSSVAALVSIDIERLKYVHEKGRYENNYAMYENALKSLMDKYAGTPEQAYAAYALAILYAYAGSPEQAYALGLLYGDLNVEGEGRSMEAIDLCTEIIERYAENAELKPLVESAAILKGKITQPSLDMAIVGLQYPDSPIMALVKYGNIDRIYLRIYSISEHHYVDEYYYSRNRFARFDSVRHDKPVAIKEIALPLKKNDCRRHSAEIMIDGLPQGFYLIAAGTVPDFFENCTSAACALLQVSSLSIALRGNGNEPETDEIYVANAKTGMLVKNAGIRCYYSSGDSQTFETGENGIASIIYRNTKSEVKKAVISNKNERLTVRNLYSLNHSWIWAKRESIFFTDRAIYRPGQTVYYKILCLDTDEKGRYSLVKNADIDVDFRSPNNKVIDTRKHVTGEYGSVAGSFTVPQGLNGTMMLTNKDGGYKYIRVEEYKRPAFEVKFDTIGRNYRPGDSIRVTGRAKAFAGYAVDNAKVQYRAVREMQYRQYRRWLPQFTVQSREIASGTVTGDDSGAFAIGFKAEAGDADTTDDNLIYSYRLTADVTDLNGETRSAEMSVRTGRKKLLADIMIPEHIVNRDSLDFKVETTNLNGEFTPAELQITVSELKSPEGILRSRLWETPDTFAMSRKEFKRYFPLDPYGDEERPEKFGKGRQLASYTDRTASRSHKISLAPLAEAPAGWYRVDIKMKDSEGTEVEYENFVLLDGNPVSKASKTPVPPVIRNMPSDWLRVIKDSGEPGEHAGFWAGGSGKKSYIYYDIILKSRVVERKSIVANAPAHIIIPVREEHRGGFTVQFLMIQDGRAYTKSCNVNVPHTDKRLDITFTSFRDRLLPGEKEKWTLNVKNAKGEKETAEMVATLYDASLEAFVHHWWFDNFYRQDSFFDNWNPYEQYQKRFAIPERHSTINFRIFDYPHINMHFMPEKEFFIRGTSTGINWNGLDCMGRNVLAVFRTVRQNHRRRNGLENEQTPVPEKEYRTRR
jgi:hypothetical protein